MEELHEKRVDFVQKVQQVVSEDLHKNGLELESVSLTGLDQTGKQYFNPDNAFDAEGLMKLTEAIETRRKKRNDIEQDTEVAIADKNRAADRLKLEIVKQTEYARLEQQREIEMRKAAQSADIVRQQAEMKRDADQAEITAKQQVEISRIMAERAVEEGRIEKDRQLKEKDISRQKTIETAEIERRQTVELAEQGRAIAIAEKSKSQSVAQAEADGARADAVKAEEAVLTVRETEKAERLKVVELVQARQAAERDAIAIKVAAEAEKLAAEDRAQAVRTLANVEAEKRRIEAEAQADAEKLHADAAARRYEVDAAGKRALNESANLLSAEQIAMQIRMALIQYLPDIIKESVKPIEKIDGIKIIQVAGLGGGNHGAGETAGGGATNLADQLVNSALRYRGQAPLVDSILNELGMNSGSIGGLINPLKPEIIKREDEEP